MKLVIGNKGPETVLFHTLSVGDFFFRRPPKEDGQLLVKCESFYGSSFAQIPVANCTSLRDGRVRFLNRNDSVLPVEDVTITVRV